MLVPVGQRRALQPAGAARSFEGSRAPQARLAGFRLLGLGAGRMRAGTLVCAGPGHVGAPRMYGVHWLRNVHCPEIQASGNSVFWLGCGLGSKGAAALGVIITTSAQRFPKLPVFGASFWVDRASGETRGSRGSRLRPSETWSPPRGPGQRPPPVISGHQSPNPHKYDSIRSPAGTSQARDARDLGKQKGKVEPNPIPCSHPPPAPGRAKRGLTQRIKIALFPASPSPSLLSLMFLLLSGVAQVSRFSQP